MKKGLYIILSLYLLTSFIFAEDTENKEEIKSLTEERRETLLYGIDSEVLTLIKKLKEEKNDSLNKEVLQVFNESLNISIRKNILDFLSSMDSGEAEDSVYILLKNNEDLSDDFIESCINYLSKNKKKEYAELFVEFIDYDKPAVSTAAIRAIGKSGFTEYSPDLIKLFEDDDFTSSSKAIIIKSLGDLRSTESVEILTDILENNDEEKSWRWYACDSLGKIGAPQSINTILSAYNSDDAILRSYAISAIGNYKDKKATDLLLHGLRDSFWKIRIASARSLGKNKINEAIPILMYKAKKDPETNVRIEALIALSEIGTSESFNFLRDLYSKKTSSPKPRAKALEMLVKHDLNNSIAVINQVMKEEWDIENSYILETTCRNLSFTKNQNLKDIFSRMLKHPSITIKIYGIRGVIKNNFTGFKDDIEKLSKEGNPMSLRKNALSAMERL